MAYCSTKLLKGISECDTESPHFTITQMKFSPSKKQGRVLKMNPESTLQAAKSHSSSLQYLHRGTPYRRDKQKKRERLQSQRKIIFSQQIATEPHAHWFRSCSQRLSHPAKPKMAIEKVSPEMVRRIYKDINQQVQSQRKLPSLKFQLTFLRSKVQTATRMVHKAPMELLTRKLEWQGRPVRKLIPYTRQDRHRIVVQGREEVQVREEDAKQKTTWLRLSGWGEDQSQGLTQRIRRL